MNIKLKKTQLKTLTKDSTAIADHMTPNIAGGSSYQSYRCPVESQACSADCFSAPGPDQVCNITGIC
ncbi:hypothetical protein J8L98_13100 [Pseudoalteromonas sp. MMG013]|uniref:Uncharacterized protein n=1 Tax=Pseudoalteromonas aurantia 208 TaxID=1314867 RepID=A0ABR9E5Z1_9GAMM|nr:MULTISPECIES: hypothetical protein [Pseudoalteromonas]MBE0366400.1 hypothetical protein [Pseudoalteromonas aurantia 208]MBQ4846543.1 hypothetical protein [Pseudoalteromonas sp. MMG005]MBQ4862627.1 hypothetical protein [Pseudoalteromonas sp. MMG013]